MDKKMRNGMNKRKKESEKDREIKKKKKLLSLT